MNSEEIIARLITFYKAAKAVEDTLGRPNTSEIALLGSSGKVLTDFWAAFDAVSGDA